MRGVTLAFMEIIAGQEIHLMKKEDSLEFHYPFERKVKASELKSISNFDLLPDSDEKFDSVYDATIENGKLKIKFKYTGTASEDKDFVLDFKKVGKQEYFAELEQIKKDVEYLKEKVEPFNFSQLSLSVVKPEYFNKTDVNLLEKRDHSVSVSVSLAGIDRFSSDFGGGNRVDFNISGVAVEFEGSSQCAAKYKNNCFQGIEYLWNKKDNKPSAIVLLSEDEKTKTEIKKLFNEIKSDFKAADFRIYSPRKAAFMTWTTKTETITLATEDNWYIDEDGFDETDIYGTNEYYEKLFHHFINTLEKSKITIYIISKRLEEELKISRSGGKSGKITDYAPYYEEYR